MGRKKFSNIFSVILRKWVDKHFNLCYNNYTETEKEEIIEAEVEEVDDDNEAENETSENSSEEGSKK